MAEVFESVIKIETGESEQSVKGLKKQINDLRDHILNLEKGTDEYNDAVAQLMDSQRRLDEVMSLTKKTATALDGSYDALVHQMSLLKKEWKATNDAARRNELGKQIDELNDQLKELDASTGNFQRNVGNYPKEMGKMQEATKETAVACKSFQQQMSEMNESIEPTKQKFEAVGKISSGIASGFAVVQGSMALLGVESENLEKTFVKLQAAMALMQGIKGLGDLVEGVGKAKVAFQGLGDKVKTVSKAMGKTGWLAVIMLVVTAVTALVAHLKKKNQEIKDGTSALREYNKVSAQAQSSVAGEILKVQMLNKIATDNTETTENRNIAAKELCRLMGIQANNANILAVEEGKLQSKIDGVTASMIKQAIAAAQMEKLTELYKKYVDLQNGEVDFSFWEKAAAGFKTILGNSIIGTIMGTTGAAEGAKSLVGSWAKQLEDAKTAYTNFAKTLTTNTDAKDLLAALGLTEDGNKTTGDGVTTVAKKVEEVTKAIQKSIEEIANADIAHIDRVYARKIAQAKLDADTKEKAAKEEYRLTLERENEKLEVLKDAIVEARNFEETNQKAIDELKTKVAEQEDKVAKTTNKKKKATEEEKLKTLKDSLKAAEEAQKQNNVITNNLIQDKADQEIAIEQLKYAELERLRNEALEKERKAIADANGRLAFEHQLSMRQLAIDSPSSQETKNRNVGALLGLGELDAQKAEKTQREIDNEYYIQAYEAEQTFLQEKLRLNQEFLAKTTDAETKLQLEQVIADTQLQIDEGMYAEKERLRQLDLQKEQEKQQKTQAIFNASLQATSALLNGIADAYEETQNREDVSDAEKVKNAKKVKGLRIAAATIDMLQGATTAFATAMQLGPIAGPIIGGINAAAVVASGVANIAKIKNTKEDGSGSGGASVTPANTAFATELPATYTRQITGASEIDALNQDQRVYILESDIQASNKRVQVRESESSF